MNSFLKPFISWFGYSGRERRASMILLTIMILVLVVRFTIPERRVEIQDMSALLIPETGQPGKSNFVNSDTSVNKIAESDARVIKTRRTAFQLKKIELNICDSTDLERLPGIGPILSARIIKYRNLLGGYVSVAQLKEVYGLRDSTYMIICDRITADSSFIKKININSAGFSELNRHPYLERYDVQGILKYREMKGRIDGISDLTDNKIMTGERALKVLPYLRFD